MLPYFIMLVGIPGSGKSIWTKEVQSETTAVVSPDEIRKVLTGSISSQSVNLEAWAQAKRDTVNWLCYGKNVILDATNVDASYWQDFIKGLPECHMVANLFEVEPLVACGRIEKDMAGKVNRSDVPEHVVYRMYGQYLHTKKIIDNFFEESTVIEETAEWVQDITDSRKRFGGHFEG